MKIAVLADIHSNLSALNAVLNKCKELNISHYIIAGDHISDCPSPIEVIDLLLELNATYIKGNREQYILDYLSSCSNDWENYNQMSNMQWTLERLRTKDIEWLQGLKEHETLNFENMDSIKVVHGSPDDMFEHLYGHKEERLKEVLLEINEKVLICGHSHLPWSKRMDDKLVVNPGSVGVSFNNSVAADFAVLTWCDEIWKVDHYSEGYSYDELYKSFISSGLYTDGGIWGKLVLQSLREGKNRNMEFIHKVIDEKKKSHDSTSGYFPNSIWDRCVESWKF